MIFISILAGLLFFVGFIILIKKISQKKIKSSIISCIVWAVFNSVLLMEMKAQDAVNGQIIGIVVSAWLLAWFLLLSGLSRKNLENLKKDQLSSTKLDTFLSIGTIAGLWLSAIFDNPNLGITTGLIFLIILYYPAIKSAWKNSQNIIAGRSIFTVLWFSSLCAVIAIPRWTIADAMQPITFFVALTIIMFIIYFLSPKKNN